MTILLIALSLVRERERGTLEQLTMTPVAPLGLMVGKMIPYGVLAFGELCAILLVMRVVFLVPIHGNVLVLLALSLPFLLTVLGIGAGDFDEGANAGRGVSVGDGDDSALGVSFRLHFPDREHAAVLSGDQPADSGDVLHPDLARDYFARGGDSRSVGRCSGSDRMGCAAILLAAFQFVRRKAI